jgi:hypothetical protein
MPRHDVADLTIDEVLLDHPRLHLRVMAHIGRAKYEFVRLKSGAELEVYDHPKRWDGLPRFCGYASVETADKLERIARRHAGACHA